MKSIFYVPVFIINIKNLNWINVPYVVLINVTFDRFIGTSSISHEINFLPSPTNGNKEDVYCFKNT